MAEDALIRLANLKALGHSPADLVRLIGNTYPYWRDLLAGEKSFGEKAARKIEAKLGLPRGCLDIEGSCEQRRGSGVPVKEPAVPYHDLEPAERVLLENFKDLPDPDQVELAAEIADRAEKARKYIQKVLAAQQAPAPLQVNTPEPRYSASSRPSTAQPGAATAVNGRKTSILEELSARLDEAANGQGDKDRRRRGKGNARRGR